jgi:hypothetical protein
MLAHLFGIARSLSFDIYIRDVSNLDFPTYHIFIPGMSERTCGSPDDQLHHHAMCARLAECLLRLPKLSKAKIQ